MASKQALGAGLRALGGLWALSGLWAAGGTVIGGLDAGSPHPASFSLDAPAEVLATVGARCDRCAWNVPGREAVTLKLELDGRYVAHVPLVRAGLADYEVLVGAVAAGRHTLRVGVDPDLTATGLRDDASAAVDRVAIRAIGEADADHTAISLAPIVYARPNTIGRFTDAPVFMWYEREPTGRGVRYRYSVIFTNEDGGTPADRLMATWGRTTDIEYVYSAEVDDAGKLLADDIQGPKHEILPFNGTREGRHPLLWVSTDNNMVLDRGTTAVRYAPAPVPFPLDGVSREAVMDANPWLYELAAKELEREGKVAANAPAGQGTIPDPRRFVYVEACGVIGDAAVALELRVRDEWLRSDRGVAEYRIARDGCFRAAVPVGVSVTPVDLHELRVRAYARPPRSGGAGTAARSVRIDRINTVFMLDGQHRPGKPLLRWTGPATVDVGSALEIPISR